MPDGSVDAVISNCVINLVPDKDAVLRERSAAPDAVVLGELAESIRLDREAWAGRMAGALEEGEYGEKLSSASFSDVKVRVMRAHSAAGPCCRGCPGALSDGRYALAFALRRGAAYTSSVGDRWRPEVWAMLGDSVRAREGLRALLVALAALLLGAHAAHLPLFLGQPTPEAQDAPVAVHGARAPHASRPVPAPPEARAGLPAPTAHRALCADVGSLDRARSSGLPCPAPLAPSVASAALAPPAGGDATPVLGAPPPPAAKHRALLQVYRI